MSMSRSPERFPHYEIVACLVAVLIGLCVVQACKREAKPAPPDPIPALEQRIKALETHAKDQDRRLNWCLNQFGEHPTESELNRGY